ncbi:MAG: 30S ribosomal protein S17 [Candidatus Jordarchaeum sp.]|uniref:30S ribosomal protein S17 n=1 Tax=Candidatus Jordarchaeum sp. TaxID=2823881 RepID=UPI00404A5E4E
MARNIGIEVTPPKSKCDDAFCPFHGRLPVRGRIFEGVVVSDKMQNTVIVRRDYLWYVKKYRRYERRHSHTPAHRPSCIDVKVGDVVKIMECRRISKTVAFVVVEKKEE